MMLNVLMIYVEEEYVSIFFFLLKYSAFEICSKVNVLFPAVWLMNFLVFEIEKASNNLQCILNDMSVAWDFHDQQSQAFTEWYNAMVKITDLFSLSDIS